MLAERTEEPMKSSSDIYRKALLYIDPRDAKLVELVSSSAKRKEIERCLDTGADPNVFNGGQCAIHAAVCKGDASICSLLIERGSELNLADSDGQRPLHLAAQKSFTSCVHVLLMHGARTDSRNFNGDTPLHCASRSNSLGVTKLLLSSKADVQVLNLDGNTPVHLAARAGAAEVLSELLKNVMESNGGEAVRSLINFRNLAGDTALQMAVNSNTSLEGRREAVTLLMEYGALSTDENNTLLPELERFLSKAESASNVPKEDSNREKLFYSSDYSVEANLKALATILTITVMEIRDSYVLDQSQKLFLDRLLRLLKYQPPQLHKTITLNRRDRKSVSFHEVLQMEKVYLQRMGFLEAARNLHTISHW
eukprot:CAMPEP_0182445570 /NCGR_PEP_ID=MMETSP1172-20130603/3653_1 /TAXON_ID=708627 /ORGANISM="Timspurckia oligopyrenoides, Strain CCMP3278" /LENGTH=366 /DNA_ID=CAMNT_0024641373 /DNA_START=63 /DNA_END=1161 /DNA_ORIENTATION=-